MGKTYSIPITEVQVEDEQQPLFLCQENFNMPSNLSDERLREIAEDAIHNGHINHGDLTFILTMDEQYPDEIIQRLWNKYHQGKQHEKILRSRLSFWMHFLPALALRKLILPNRIFNGLDGVPILPLSFLDKDTGEIVKFNRKINPDGDGALILLEDLKKYFTEILRIPSPSLLFPNANNNNETFSKLDFSKILSIDIITEKLKQDPLYCRNSYCEDKCNWLINKYTTSENPWDEKKKKFINNHSKKMEPIKIMENRGENRPYQKYFLHLLCIYSGLNVYRTLETEPIRWSGPEYAKDCSGDLLIDRNELKVILKREISDLYPKGLPLPVFWYEDEDNNTKEVASNNLVEDLKDIITGELPKFDFDASVEDAKRNKYIALDLLPYVMASDEQYNAELLLKLWEKYHCNRRGPKKPPIETYENRVGVWYHLFERLAYGRVQGIPIKRSSPPYLNLYHFNDEEGILEKYDRRIDPGDPQVKLEDLKKFFSETIEIPLPASLFPQDIISQKDHGIIGNDHGLISTISGTQLMKTWGVGAHELLQLIINGLPVLKPDFMPLINEALSGDIREMAIRRVLGKQPENVVPGLLFNITDLQKYKNKYPELPPIEIFPQKDSHDLQRRVEIEKTGKKQLLPCAPGTKWEDIKITLIANDTVRIKTPEGEKRFTYHMLGLSDERKADASKILWPLLVAFAKSKGEINPADNKFIENLTEHTKRLNKHLKTLFGISDSIFKGHYKKYRGYKTRIQFFDETQTPIERPSSKSIREEIADEFKELENKYHNY